MLVIVNKDRQYWNGTEFVRDFTKAIVSGSATSVYRHQIEAAKKDSGCSMSGLNEDEWAKLNSQYL